MTEEEKQVGFDVAKAKVKVMAGVFADRIPDEAILDFVVEVVEAVDAVRDSKSVG